MSKEPVAYINVEKRSLEWAKPMRWETPTVANLEPVPLYTHPAPDEANDFTPDWDVVAPMVEEQKRMAKRIEELEAALRGDVEPVAWMSPDRERLEFSRSDTVYGSHTIPLYTHPVPDVVAQLVEALDATKAWLDAEENHEFEPDFWKRANMARTAQNLVNAALAAAKEAGV